MKKSGTLREKLSRNNKQLREDRSDEIAEDIFVSYNRRIEDRKREIQAIDRKLNRMLDLSPDNNNARMSSKDFEVEVFLDQREALIKERISKQVLLDTIQLDYDSLFADDVKSQE